MASIAIMEAAWQLRTVLCLIFSWRWPHASTVWKYQEEDFTYPHRTYAVWWPEGTDGRTCGWPYYYVVIKYRKGFGGTIPVRNTYYSGIDAASISCSLASLFVDIKNSCWNAICPTPLKTLSLIAPFLVTIRFWYRIINSWTFQGRVGVAFRALSLPLFSPPVIAEIFFVSSPFRIEHITRWTFLPLLKPKQREREREREEKVYIYQLPVVWVY